MSMPDFSKMTPAEAEAAQAAIAAQLAAVKNFNIEAFTLLGIALVATGLRTYSRLSAVGIRRFQADDYLVLVGAVGAFSSLPIRRAPDLFSGCSCRDGYRRSTR
jgi:hypothetical protein